MSSNRWNLFTQSPSPPRNLPFSPCRKRRKDRRINRLSKPLLTTCRGIVAAISAKVSAGKSKLRKKKEGSKGRRTRLHRVESLQTRCLLAANKSRKSHPRRTRLEPACRTLPTPDVDVKKISTAVEGRTIDRGGKQRWGKSDRSGRRESSIRWKICRGFGVEDIVNWYRRSETNLINTNLERKKRDCRQFWNCRKQDILGEALTWTVPRIEQFEKKEWQIANKSNWRERERRKRWPPFLLFFLFFFLSQNHFPSPRLSQKNFPIILRKNRAKPKSINLSIHYFTCLAKLLGRCCSLKNKRG